MSISLRVSNLVSRSVHRVQGARGDCADEPCVDRILGRVTAELNPKTLKARIKP